MPVPKNREWALGWRDSSGEEPEGPGESDRFASGWLTKWSAGLRSSLHFEAPHFLGCFAMSTFILLLLGGVAGTIGMTVFLLFPRWLGWAHVDVIRAGVALVVGSANRFAFPVGMAIHIGMGIGFAFVYYGFLVFPRCHSTLSQDCCPAVCMALQPCCWCRI